MTLAIIFLPYLFVGIVLTSHAYIPVLVSVAAKSSNFFPLYKISLITDCYWNLQCSGCVSPITSMGLNCEQITRSWRLNVMRLPTYSSGAWKNWDSLGMFSCIAKMMWIMMCSVFCWVSTAGVKGLSILYMILFLFLFLCIYSEVPFKPYWDIMCQQLSSLRIWFFNLSQLEILLIVGMEDILALYALLALLFCLWLLVIFTVTSLLCWSCLGL